MTARQQAIFTFDELAAYLKVGKRTLYRLASHGEIPAFKVGGTWRFRQSEIDRWINDQTQAGRKKGFFADSRGDSWDACKRIER